MDSEGKTLIQKIKKLHWRRSFKVAVKVLVGCAIIFLLSEGIAHAFLLGKGTLSTYQVPVGSVEALVSTSPRNTYLPREAANTSQTVTPNVEPTDQYGLTQQQRDQMQAQALQQKLTAARKEAEGLEPLQQDAVNSDQKAVDDDNALLLTSQQNLSKDWQGFNTAMAKIISDDQDYNSASLHTQDQESITTWQQDIDNEQAEQGIIQSTLSKDQAKLQQDQQTLQQTKGYLANNQ